MGDLLKLQTCIVNMLDVSNTPLDSTALVQALASNVSLRSLDVRMVPKMAEHYEALGGLLLEPGSTSRLAYLRCDSFDVLEGEALVSLRERPLAKGAMRLLTGLLKNNTDVQELDLGATS